MYPIDCNEEFDKLDCDSPDEEGVSDVDTDSDLFTLILVTPASELS